jgi:disulfide bond formation protein DsbB
MRKNKVEQERKEKKTAQTSLEINFPKTNQEQDTRGKFNYNNDVYYTLAKENYFYLRDLMHETNRNANEHYYKLSERLFTSATITLGFVPIIISLLKGSFSPSQKWFLTFGILFSIISIILGFVDYLEGNRFWEKMIGIFKKQTEIFDTTLNKMRKQPVQIPQYFREAIIYIEGMDQPTKEKSKNWATIIQFVFLLFSIMFLIICYLISVF